MTIINIRMRSPWLWPDFIFNHLPIGREHAKLLKILHGFSRKVVCFLQSLILFLFSLIKIIEERLATFNVEEVTNNDDKKSTRRLVFLDSLLDSNA